MSAVSQVTDSSSYYLSDTTERTAKSSLGKDDFLKLLMTQMRYQDPLNPMDNNQYLAQMAQLSSLEQMTNMAQSFEATRAFSLVGKSVTVPEIDNSTGETVAHTGKVERVIKDGGEYRIVVDGREYKLDSVEEVVDDSVGADEINA